MAFNWLLSRNMAATPYFNERTCTILVVEDEALIRDFLRNVLRRMGHAVLEARDGAEGLTVSRNFSGRIDLVIADVRMPKVDGLTMVRLLQAKRPAMKVLLISGDSAESLGPRPPAPPGSLVRPAFVCCSSLGIVPLPAEKICDALVFPP